ncbi:MAG TPA: cytidine deaminase [Candidatus Angelobacter sp.]|nr:cytidine deaminase [Candidatus Angelobacter sp.]
MPQVPLTDKERAMLLGTATQALEHAYAPYSNFRVGAALITDDGRLFTGCNVENASYGLTICAERAAIFHAVRETEGKLRLRALAVVNANQRPCSPCGACRQVIAEFGANTVVIYRGQEDYTEATITELLPETFRLS